MRKKTGRKPKITLCRTDHDRLLGLATAMEDRDPALAETMLSELERARVVKDNALPATVVRMGSSVTYTADDNDPKTVTLVFPAEADIAEGRVSVTTPVGTALIGLSAGQSINWTARNGQIHRLTIVEIRQPEEEAG
ncbi:nucleoside diphosphate kinase regulator [Chelativorans sp. M5D2P16]|uniref:nucleoside diphosphate kinase regulator n=1 Tax=Chelativorans sp. M5D2P16 TaxID=3095678 RepID=UPI002ACAAB0E|nr:nucleoside diphosphate kinase regulator [Chelativorans sp. M5D2P16]MDZ5697942.1 nucleoside diphosphate kinase regulator [Chelativorans sp. M5D2P16]